MSRTIAVAIATVVTTATLGAAAPAIASAAPATAYPPVTSATAAQATRIQWFWVCLNVPLGSVSISFCV